jgi:hypothetical protein
MKAVNYRQGDVIIIPTTESTALPKLPHLKLALGEVTGHSHQITAGQAVLHGNGMGDLHLSVMSAVATLSHEEHSALSLPKGEYTIKIQRNYTPSGWESVKD